MHRVYRHDRKLRNLENLQAMIPSSTDLEGRSICAEKTICEIDRSPLSRELSLTSATSACLCLLVISTDVAKSCTSFSMKHFNRNIYPMNSSLVVTVTEIFKTLLVTAIHFYSNGENPLKRIDGRIVIPCALYAITNNLFFWALHYVSPALWIVLTQMRIVFLLVIYRCAFDKNITAAQYTGAFLLMIGVGLAQLDLIGDFDTIVGPALAIATASSIMSAVAGVFTEIVLKEGGESGMWKNQIHLYSGSAMISMIPTLVSSFGVKRKIVDFQENFDVLIALIVSTVLLTAFNGICVSLVIKKLDNVIRFQMSAATYVLTAALNKYIFPEKFHLSLWYLISIVLILISVLLMERKKFDFCR